MGSQFRSFSLNVCSFTRPVIAETVWEDQTHVHHSSVLMKTCAPWQPRCLPAILRRCKYLQNRKVHISRHAQQKYCAARIMQSNKYAKQMSTGEVVQSNPLVKGA
jgi:hypothetical protein